ncbi:class III poly(R)-hydroxyalkanoic acid synthase PhaE subunit [Vulcaniibacterium tengchongense]|uniref:Poly(3-hydroxyalkanoate) polymerase subunit PhaE n=2 Tax=Vulcaniibacterium tengchongense TaxID=1273429 RepID=A0A3N4VEM3_9GAMM|nr:class III poly(R)-hydroxyalkanoic acid synthase PhaE subunit [Vulcaniibacterium tengchongense]
MQAGFEDFDALARRYWSAWGEALRAAGAPAASPPAPALPGWNEALDWWSRLAKGGRGEPDNVLDRFNAQAGAWLDQMQQLAAQFAGRDAGAAEIAAAWRKMLGGDVARPLQDAFAAMHGAGAQDPARGTEPWLALLQRWQEEGRGWLGLPAFGLGREHQERWQRLAQAQLDAQAQAQAYHALLAEAGQDAFKRFEGRLEQRQREGRPLASARELFDLWVDAAEEAYAEIALSPRFRDAYAALVNSQMKLRKAAQAELEQACSALGLPTRTELDSAHRKIAQLERELRRLREALQESRNAPANTAPGPGKPVRTATRASARKRAPSPRSEG